MSAAEKKKKKKIWNTQKRKTKHKWNEHFSVETQKIMFRKILDKKERKVTEGKEEMNKGCKTSLIT